MTEKDNGPHGVGGWLALLVAGMVVLGPLLNIGSVYVHFAATEREYPALAQVAEWSSFKTVEWVTIFIFCAISIYGGLGLATKRTPDAVSKAKLVLWFNYPISLIVTTMIIPVTIIPGIWAQAETAVEFLAKTAVLFLASLIGLAIWTAYLNRSKRVKNTYGLRDGGQYAMAIPSDEGTNKVTQAIDYPASIDEDRVYRQIAEELETGATDKGMWTRLFAECRGDEKQTKVLYIKQRAEHLISAERLRFEHAVREHAAREHAAEVERSLDEMYARYAALNEAEKPEQKRE